MAAVGHGERAAGVGGFLAPGLARLYRTGKVHGRANGSGGSRRERTGRRGTICRPCRLRNRSSALLISLLWNFALGTATPLTFRTLSMRWMRSGVCGTPSSPLPSYRPSLSLPETKVDW